MPRYQQGQSMTCYQECGCHLKFIVVHNVNLQQAILGVQHLLLQLVAPHVVQCVSVRIQHTHLQPQLYRTFAFSLNVSSNRSSNWALFSCRALVSLSPLMLRAALNIPDSNTMSISNGRRVVIWNDGKLLMHIALWIASLHELKRHQGHPQLWVLHARVGEVSCQSFCGVTIFLSKHCSTGMLWL